MMNSDLAHVITCLLLREVRSRTQVVSEISTCQVVQSQIKMVSVLERAFNVDYEWTIQAA